MELSTVRDINKVVFKRFTEGSSPVLCDVGNDSGARAFVYEVFRARSRKGVLEVRTCDGWKTPFRVYVPLAVIE